TCGTPSTHRAAASEMCAGSWTLPTATRPSSDTLHAVVLDPNGDSSTSTWFGAVHTKPRWDAGFHPGGSQPHPETWRPSRLIAVARAAAAGPLGYTPPRPGSTCRPWLAHTAAAQCPCAFCACRRIRSPSSEIATTGYGDAATGTVSKPESACQRRPR